MRFATGPTDLFRSGPWRDIAPLRREHEHLHRLLPRGLVIRTFSPYMGKHPDWPVERGDQRGAGVTRRYPLAGILISEITKRGEALALARAQVIPAKFHQLTEPGRPIAVIDRKRID